MHYTGWPKKITLGFYSIAQASKKQMTTHLFLKKTYIHRLFTQGSDMMKVTTTQPLIEA